MIKCSFCDAQTRHVGEKEVEGGWGKAVGTMYGVKVNLVHCPEHFDEFSQALLEKASEAAAIQENKKKEKSHDTAGEKTGAGKN